MIALPPLSTAPGTHTLALPRVCPPGSEFARIEGEMRAYDEKRETVIKRSRNIQKLAKQAIFSLHRGAADEANQRLAAAKKGAEELLPIISAAPTLRPGSFSNAIEEYAEVCVCVCVCL